MSYTQVGIYCNYILNNTDNTFFWRNLNLLLCMTTLMILSSNTHFYQYCTETITIKCYAALTIGTRSFLLMLNLQGFIRVKYENYLYVFNEYGFSSV